MIPTDDASLKERARKEQKSVQQLREEIREKQQIALKELTPNVQDCADFISRMNILHATAKGAKDEYTVRDVILDFGMGLSQM